MITAWWQGGGGEWDTRQARNYLRSYFYSLSQIYFLTAFYKLAFADLARRRVENKMALDRKQACRLSIQYHQAQFQNYMDMTDTSIWVFNTWKAPWRGKKTVFFCFYVCLKGGFLLLQPLEGSLDGGTVFLWRGNIVLLQPLEGSLAGETETDKQFKPKFGRRSKVKNQIWGWIVGGGCNESSTSVLQGSKKSGNLKSDGLEFGDGTEHGKYRCHDNIIISILSFMLDRLI